MKKLMIIFVFFMVAAFQGLQDHTLLINSPLEERTPALSPDGSKLAFLRSSDSGRNLELVIYSLKRMQQRVPNSSITINSPAVWYNDNQRLLASVKQDDGSYKLAVIDSENGNVSPPLFTDNVPEGDQLFPDLSNDNTKVAFSVLMPANFLAETRPNFDIIVANFADGSTDIVVSTPYRDMWPRFDTKNTGLYFFSRFASKGKNDDIFHIDLKTKQIDKIIESNGNDFAPSISPDGSKLAFSSNRSGEPALYIHTLTTGETTRLTKPRLRATHPVWSPNGNQLYFTARQTNDQNNTGRGDIAIIPIKLLHLLDR
jgi:Tol biopolymer transport system component